MPASSSPVLEHAKAPAPLTEDEPEELARFRNEWFAELQKRKIELQPSGSSAGTSQSQAGAGSGQRLTAPRSPDRKPLSRPAIPTNPIPARALPTSHPAVNNGELAAEAHMPPALRKALNVYRRAVEHEQSGNLDEALVSYRQAFRLHENVDRAFRREQMLSSIVKEQEEKTFAAHESSTEVEDLSASFQSAVTIKPSTVSKPTVVTGTLASIVRGFPADIVFEPEDEKLPIFLNSLPEELLVLIIGKLDLRSIERFASVSRKARVLSLDSGIWRELVRVTYKPPQIPDLESMVPVIERLRSDYRRVFIEQPRVRLDGVYIAICHYVRPGLSENQWVSITHLITYHRYLRFFPNGQVLSLLANEEKSPQEVISILKPTLRMKGLFLGHWKLHGTTVHLSDLIDASGRFALPSASTTGVISGAFPESSAEQAPGMVLTDYGFVPASQAHGHGHSSTGAQPDQARYIFDMTLNLRSKPLGRWNRMDIQSYDSVHLETGDVHPVALKHERPFWFSKVRSYA